MFYFFYFLWKIAFSLLFHFPFGHSSTSWKYSIFLIAVTAALCCVEIRVIGKWIIFNRWNLLWFLLLDASVEEFQSHFFLCCHRLFYMVQKRTTNIKLWTIWVVDFASTNVWPAPWSMALLCSSSFYEHTAPHITTSGNDIDQQKQHSKSGEMMRFLWSSSMLYYFSHFLRRIIQLWAQRETFREALNNIIRVYGECVRSCSIGTLCCSVRRPLYALCSTK